VMANGKGSRIYNQGKVPNRSYCTSQSTPYYLATDLNQNSTSAFTPSYYTTMPFNHSNSSAFGQTERQRFEPSFRRFLEGQAVRGEEGELIEEGMISDIARVTLSLTLLSVLRASLVQTGNGDLYVRNPTDEQFTCDLHKGAIDAPSQKWQIQSGTRGEEPYTLCTECFSCVTELRR